jgi:hypothetical protein
VLRDEGLERELARLEQGQNPGARRELSGVIYSRSWVVGAGRRGAANDGHVAEGFVQRRGYVLFPKRETIHQEDSEATRSWVGRHAPRLLTGEAGRLRLAERERR